MSKIAETNDNKPNYQELTKQLIWIMKKQLTILLSLPALALALIIASCTKEGPEGPAGENGINGTDGTATCGQCHNAGESFLAKVIQWEDEISLLFQREKMGEQSRVKEGLVAAQHQRVSVPHAGEDGQQPSQRPLARDEIRQDGDAK